MPGPIVLGESSTASGWTRVQYRRALADQLGRHAVLTATSAASASNTPDATRYVVSSSLRDDEWPPEQYDETWLFVTTGAQAGVQKRVLSRGYYGPLSILALSSPFSAPLASGSELELTEPLPSQRYGTVKGLNQIVNEALARIRTEARLTFTGNGTNSYALTAYPWLTRREQIRGIYDRLFLTALDNPVLSPHKADLNLNGATVSLETGPTYTTADTFYLSVFVRGDQLIKSGGTWDYSTTGLTDDTQEAEPPVAWVVTFGMVKALQHLSYLTLRDKRLDKEARALRLADLARQRQQWARSAVDILQRQFPQQISRGSDALVRGPVVVGTPPSHVPGGSSWP